jgi:hypothetical protein
VAEGARLESVYTFTGIGGSNPSLSASIAVIEHLRTGDTYTDTNVRKGSPMANREVTLTRRVQTRMDGGMPRSAVC